eukprot:Hpha_TRINITY_DN1814_c0_g1::TRINITY_DN1814_c0_g1_i1::g.170571::m.170571
MTVDRQLYTSHHDFVRAKRLHLTNVAAVAQPPPPSSPVRMRQHPCSKGPDGPELREWKFSSARFVDPRETLPATGLHSSQRDLTIRKYTHGHVIPPLDPAGPPAPRDPQEFRHVSQHELALEVKANKTPLYPVRAGGASPQVSPAPRPQLVHSPQAGDGSLDTAGRSLTSQRRLAHEKTQHLRGHCASVRSASAPPPSEIAPAGSPTNAYYKRLERARAMREAASPERPPPPPCAESEQHRTPRRAAVPSTRQAVGISLVLGDRYPASPDSVAPRERDEREFKHYSQAQMRDEKKVSATPIHPLPAPPPAPLEVDGTVCSQQTFANQKRRHNRTHAHSPAASPARSPGAHPGVSPGRGASSKSPSPARSHPPPPAPPRYVGIRPAGGAPNLSANRLSISPEQPQTIA